MSYVCGMAVLHPSRPVTQRKQEAEVFLLQIEQTNQYSAQYVTSKCLLVILQNAEKRFDICWQSHGSGCGLGVGPLIRLGRAPERRSSASIAMTTGSNDEKRTDEQLLPSDVAQDASV